MPCRPSGCRHGRVAQVGTEDLTVKTEGMLDPQKPDRGVWSLGIASEHQG